MDDDLVLIQARLVVDSLAGVLGVTGQTESLGLAEGGRGSDLGLLVGVDLKNRVSSAKKDFDASMRLQVVDGAIRQLSLLTPFRAALAAVWAFLEPALPLVPDHSMTHQQSPFLR